jgi:hypothetical protein
MYRLTPFTCHTSHTTTTVCVRTPGGVYTLRMRGTVDSPSGNPTRTDLIALAGRAGGVMRFEADGRKTVCHVDGPTAVAFLETV